MIILRTVKNFSSLNVVASILLFLTAILAAVVANSSLSSVYQDFLLQELHLRIGDFNLLSHGGHNLTMIEFINDCLMTIFFLAVGLEIKRELLVGELSSFRKAILPFIAACGGMIFPVLVYYFLVTPGTPETQGMAIPSSSPTASASIRSPRMQHKTPRKPIFRKISLNLDRSNMRDQSGKSTLRFRTRAARS